MKLNSILIIFFLLWVTGVMIYVLPVSRDNPSTIREFVKSSFNKN